MEEMTEETMSVTKHPIKAQRQAKEIKEIKGPFLSLTKPE